MDIINCKVCNRNMNNLYFDWSCDGVPICTQECFERYQRDKLAEKEVSMGSISCIGDNCIHYNIGQGGAVCSIGEKNCTLAKREEKAVTVSDNTCTGNCNKCERTIISKDSTRSSEYECANCGSKFTSVNDHDSADTHYCCAECEYESMVTNNKYIHKCTCCGKLTDGLIHIDGEQLCKDCGFDSKGRASKLSDYECACCGDTYIAAVSDEENVDVHLCCDDCVKNFEGKVWEDNTEPVAVKYDGDKLRYDLLDPFVLEEVVKVFTIGSRKYSDKNYLKGNGLEPERVLASVQRHIAEYRKGEWINTSDGDCSHLAHAITGLMMVLEIENKRRG